MNAFEGTGRAAPAWTRAAGAPGAGEAEVGRAAAWRKAALPIQGWKFRRRIRQSGAPLSPHVTSP